MQILQFVEPTEAAPRGSWAYVDACNMTSRVCQCDSEPMALFGFIETVSRVPAQMCQGWAESRRRCARGGPSPGADVPGASRVLAQMWQARAESRRRCARREPSPGADVPGASRVAAQVTVTLFTIEWLSRFLTVHAVRHSSCPIGPQVMLSLMPVESTSDALSLLACTKRVIRFLFDVCVFSSS